MTTSLGCGTGSNVQTEFSAQTTTMTFLKLFVKLFTSILLITTTMQNDRSYQLQNTGNGKIYSVHGRWKEHVNQNFAGLHQSFNNHYCFYMEEDIFKTLFVDPVAQDNLKSEAL